MATGNVNVNERGLAMASPETRPTSLRSGALLRQPPFDMVDRRPRSSKDQAETKDHLLDIEPLDQAGMSIWVALTKGALLALPTLPAS